jgi:hypothetical protein
MSNHWRFWSEAVVIAGLTLNRNEVQVLAMLGQTLPK